MKRYTSSTWSVELFLVIAFAAASLLALDNLCTGCSTTPAALSTDQRLYQASTNVVGIIDRLAPILPPPFCSVAEAGTVLATAGRRLERLAA